MFKFIHDIGFHLAMMILFFIFASLLILVNIYEAMYLKEHASENFNKVGIVSTGYAFGVIFISFFYR